METRLEPVPALVESLTERGRPAWARWALERDGDQWRLRHAEITVGGEPPGYERRAWTYADRIFVERRATLGQVSAALSGKTVRIGRLSVRPVPLQNTAHRTRLQSFADFGGHRLPWPATRYEVARQEPSNANMGHDPLISLDSPSFAHYEAAFAAFFRPTGPSRWQQGAGVIVTDVDTDARIAGLTIRPGEIIVDIAGDDLRGCGLQGSSGGRSHTVKLDGPGSLKLPLPEPFVSELMIVLADSRGWRDLRVVNPPGMPNAVDPSIVWDDPQLELEALVAGGEGAGVEFKSKLPSKATDSIRTALKAVPAFANGAGGALLFGVDDNGEVIGVEEDPTPATARLTDLIHDSVHPVPAHRIESRTVDGRAVLLVHVEAGSSKPYALFRNPPQFFIRHGATTFHATREEVIQLASWSQPGNRYV